MLDQVNALCEGKNACEFKDNTIQLENDQCSKVVKKYLEIEYSCSGGKNPNS